MNSFKYLLMIDLDELIVPYKQDTLAELIAGDLDDDGGDDYIFNGNEKYLFYRSLVKDNGASWKEPPPVPGKI